MRISWPAWLLSLTAILAVVVNPMSVEPCLAETPAPQDEPITAIAVATDTNTPATDLGAALFSDPRLSGNGRISCTSCHDLHTNGATSRALDAAPDGNLKSVNTITVFNAALNFRLNWTGNIRTLEDHAAAAIESPDIMNGNADDVVAALRVDPSICRRFRLAYGTTPSWQGIVKAIAAFERTLVTPDSAFDRWLKGDSSALSAEQAAGYALFKSVGCASCHQGANVGGNLFEETGVAAAWPGGHKRLRVPSLRNVAVTAPYFDDGSAPTLEEAVRRMAAGQLGLALEHDQILLIVAFLGSLTGKYEGHELMQPR